MIRRAVAEENVSIAELFERSHSTQAFLPRVHTMDEHTAFFAQRIAEDDVWVWDADGTILGFMILRGNDQLVHLYIEPAERGRGIGTALLEHAKRRLPGGFTLWAFQENADARAFYERRGLRAIAFGDGSGNEEGAPDVQYEWAPTAPPAARGR